MSAFDDGAEHSHGALRLLWRYSWFQACDHLPRVRLALAEVVLHAQNVGRAPEVGRPREALETGWQNADNGVRQRIETDGLPNHRRIRPIAPLPEAVADKRHEVLLRRDVFLGKERAAYLRLHSEQWEVAGAHKL